MPLENTLPQELLDTLKSPKFDDDSGMLIESIRFNDADINLTFSIRTYPNVIFQLWAITIKGVEEEHIFRNWAENIEIYSTHFLLLEYSDVFSELYFTGTTSEPERLCINIFEKLLKLSDRKSIISKYLFSPRSIKELSQQGFGLFARGPKTILNIYEQSLFEVGIKSIYIGEFEPSVTKKSLKLLVLGESYFIGQDFIFERKQ